MWEYLEIEWELLRVGAGRSNGGTCSIGEKIYDFPWKAGRTVCENGVEGQVIPGPVACGGADWMWGEMGQED